VSVRLDVGDTPGLHPSSGGVRARGDGERGFRSSSCVVSAAGRPAGGRACARPAYVACVREETAAVAGTAAVKCHILGRKS
jgi:hypothetical protein